MQVIFKNVGMIEEAEIEVNGLTVIAGENDTGKSTIGKLLFSIIKTFNRCERDTRMFQVRDIQRLIDKYYFESRKNVNDPAVMEISKAFFEELKNNALALVDKNQSKEEIDAIITTKMHSFTETIQGLSGIQVNMEEIKGHIADIIVDKPAKELVFKRSFSLYMNALMSGDIANKFSTNGNYSITGNDGRAAIFEISGTRADLDIRLNDRVYFEDATFFESPALLNLADTIRFSKTEFDKTGDTKKEAELLEKAYVPEYIRDLILKLTDQRTKGKHSKIADGIREIIGGEFYYDPDLRDFVFEKGEQKFIGVSITPGVKFLGAIGILSLSGFITGNGLLVIDEPETHIHPMWQIRFAELLVQLVKDGNYILLTSHSPYFIEALKLYSDKYIIEQDKTDFYFSHKDRNDLTSRINNVSHDISPIFKILGEPFRELEKFDIGLEE
ncbi:MAG TPA: AAA family ATPase [Candidatus Deferrimicrobium sp.]|nr:AAA family ATPase [Candidatus Kapabacteria bacterium]HLP59143.1 AAA family ATPase [Candidatus Deferrimicrobium sp.]